MGRDLDTKRDEMLAGVSRAAFRKCSAVVAARSLRTSAPALGGHGISQHRPDERNDPNMDWDFTDDNYAHIERIINKYPLNYKQSAVMPLLDLAQRQQGENGRGGWLPLAAMNKIAQILEMAPIRVYEVASFYTMYNREPVGKHLIQVCGTTPCQLNGAERIIETITEHVGIGVGETSSDGLFTMLEVECLGACVNAPMVQINDDFYEDLTTARMHSILDQLRSGGRNNTKIGPQGPRKGCIGPQGKTSLTTMPDVAPKRDFAAVKAEVKRKAEEAEKAKAAEAA